MPEVNGKHFPYTKAGYKATRRAKKQFGKKRNYSREAIKMAKEMYG